LQELLHLIWQNHESSGTTSVAPGRLRRELKHYAPWLVQRYIQQDAQEFLAYMLDALHEELKIDLDTATDLADMSTAFLENEVPPDRLEEYEAAWAWARHLQNSQSAIVDIFQGQLRSVLTCQECGYFSRKFDPFLHLSVPVTPGETALSSSLEAFAAEEHLSGADMWHCERCAKRVEATKRMELYKLPPVVMLHLKRFSFDAKVAEVRKVSSKVQLPGSTIELPVNLEKYTVSQQRGHALYDIIGIVNHHGNDANGGHYTAHCYHCVDAKWYAFDDSSVSEIKACDVWLPDAAYVLFLMKRRIRTASELDTAFDVEASKNLCHFRKHVKVAPQSTDNPESWPHMCNLVGIRRQLQLFNYMPANIDLEKLTEYRLAYQKFRAGQ
jgi:ubiquitin C-terminal hydrolase